MQEAKQKPHNNSYESGGTSSSSSSSGIFNVFDPSVVDIFNTSKMNPQGLADYLVDQNESGMALYNTAVEEGIFPNVTNDRRDIQVPSYVPEFNYYNETTPLVYSCFPVVPGFYDDGYNNLHNFSHINGKLDISDASDCPPPDADAGEMKKCEKNETLMKADELVFIKVEASAVNYHTLENSCNAMDLNLTCRDEQSIVSCDLSFNGKIDKLKEDSVREESDDSRKEETVEQEEPEKELTEEERIRNESFEMLKKEDSSLMLLLNEKSPEVSQKESDSEMSDKKSPDEETHLNEKTSTMESDPEEVLIQREIPLKSPKTRDKTILSKLKGANCRIIPPPSVTDCTMSLSDMLTSYNRNFRKSSENFEKLETNSLFIPSHTSPIGRDFVEWPAVASVCALDVNYNRNESAEQIEEERAKFCLRYIGRETASSYDFKVSHESAKKKSEKLKLANPSPNSRCKMYAVRRQQFSLASLKTLQHSSQQQQKNKILIDKKLLKKHSAKKKTPGKKKTPNSGKRRAFNIQQPRVAATRSSSKRALFTSPAYKSTNPSTSTSSRDFPNRFPKQPIFLYDDKKRRRSPSPSQDTENQCGKQRRINSPAKLLKSQSFSLLPSTSNSLDNLRARDSYQRTQSELNLAPKVAESWKPLRYEAIWNGEKMSNKVNFNVATVLREKSIDKGHEKFKQYITTLVTLVKHIFKEFYSPRHGSDSDQLKKFANLMVLQVIREEDKRNILIAAKEHLRKKFAGSNVLLNENRARSSSLMSIPQQAPYSLLNNSSSHENSLNSSNSSLNRSSSKNNETIALRENFQLNRSAEKSAAIKFRASESNLIRHNSMPNPGVLKAKRQISF